MISSFKIGRPGFPLYENPGVVFMLFLPADAAVPQGKAGLVDIRWDGAIDDGAAQRTAFRRIRWIGAWK